MNITFAPFKEATDFVNSYQAAQSPANLGGAAGFAEAVSNPQATLQRQRVSDILRAHQPQMESIWNEAQAGRIDVATRQTATLMGQLLQQTGDAAFADHIGKQLLTPVVTQYREKKLGQLIGQIDLEHPESVRPLIPQIAELDPTFAKGLLKTAHSANKDKFAQYIQEQQNQRGWNQDARSANASARAAAKAPFEIQSLEASIMARGAAAQASTAAAQLSRGKLLNLPAEQAAKKQEQDLKIEKLTAETAVAKDKASQIGQPTIADKKYDTYAQKNLQLQFVSPLNEEMKKSGQSPQTRALLQRAMSQARLQGLDIQQDPTSQEFFISEPQPMVWVGDGKFQALPGHE
jgi:hypothetical protein